MLLLDLDLAASRARYTQYDPVGTYIPGSIDRVASFGVTVTDVGRWYGGFDVRYFGPRPLVEDNTRALVVHYTGLCTRRLQISPKTKLTLDVFNLFDKQASDIDYYYQSRLKGESADGINDVHFHPVEPRTMRLSLVHNF